MSFSSQIVCDACGKAKGDVNHWWLLWRRDHGFRIAPKVKRSYIKIPSVVLMPWREPFATGCGSLMQHACGWQCVAILQARWMEDVGNMDKVAEATNG